MLGCGKASSSRKPNVLLSIPSKQAYSAEGTPWSSTQPSPTINITQEYDRYIKSNSFGKIRSKIHIVDHSNEHQESIQVEVHEEPDIDTQILSPSQECVQEALQQAKSGTLTRLVSTYFEHSEATSLLCVSLLNGVRRAFSLYSKLQNLLSLLPLDSDSNALTHVQCDRAFDVFTEFATLENPFPCPESHDFRNIRNSFSNLNQQLNHGLSKSQPRVTTTCAAVCLVAATVSVTIAAVVIASHALVALVAAPLLPACVSGIAKDKVANRALDVAARGTCFLHYDLNTIDCLVERLYSAVEDDKNLIRLGLAGGCDRHPIHLLSKQLNKNYSNIQSKLVDLEEHVCLCIAAINWTRSKILEEIHHNQSHSS